jgi:peptidoglycan/LPS O-acetylase OafA/YrhL
MIVVANHLWDWPRGGFVGVDVFFVISGFLITGNLMRDAERNGNVSFRRFYWNRVRRIVPAATVVLLLTYLAAVLIFLPFHSREVGIDGLWAFVFMSNWWFGIQGTDYFHAATDAVSPLQHYWSLSIEEQFYFVWPALVFVISAVVVRKAWGHERRMQLAGIVMGGIVAASLAWAIWETLTSPMWAYFNTFSRVWELGVGAILACTVGALGRIPGAARSVLSWLGLALIAASLFLISEQSAGVPAPWMLLPVAGAALVIAGGVGGEPKYQALLRNPVSGYIGDISYSLYLVHWPVIVLLGSLVDGGWEFSVAVLALSFGLAITSYHFVENPLRRADWPKFLEARREIRKRRWRPQPATKYASLGALSLVLVAMLSITAQPTRHEDLRLQPSLAAINPEPDPSASLVLGPLTAALQTEIVSALKATEWPALDPSMEAVASADPAVASPGVPGCGGTIQQRDCVWGSPTAPTKVVIVGNSVAVYYAQSLRDIALASNGQIQLRALAMPGCNFVTDPIFTADADYLQACPGRKQQLVDYINASHPDVVIMSHNYSEKQVNGTDRVLTPGEWAQSMRQFVDQFIETTKLVLLAPPPGGVLITDCYGHRGSTPADCVGRVGSYWLAMADAERGLAESLGGQWVDSRPWFCSPNGYCPSFAGNTPTRLDLAHMLPAYGVKIVPVINETLVGAGVF